MESVKEFKTAEELRKEHNDRRFKEFQRGIESDERRIKFLQRVRDIRDVVNWLVVLPAIPIIYIIQAIRGEL